MTALADEIARDAVAVARLRPGEIAWCSDGAREWRWERPLTWGTAIGYARGLLDARAATAGATAAEREVWEIVRAHQAPRRERAAPGPLRVEWAEPPR